MAVGQKIRGLVGQSMSGRRGQKVRVLRVISIGAGSGSLTAATSCTAFVWMIGGGGGGAQLGNGFAGGGGGGAATYAEAPMTSGQTLSYIVGAAGPGALSNNSPGADGGDSILVLPGGRTVIAGGGKGGLPGGVGGAGGLFRGGLRGGNGGGGGTASASGGLSGANGQNGGAQGGIGNTQSTSIASGGGGGAASPFGQLEDFSAWLSPGAGGIGGYGSGSTTIGAANGGGGGASCGSDSGRAGADGKMLIVIVKAVRQ